MTKRDYEEIWQAAHTALRQNGLRELSERLTPDVEAEAQDESHEEREFRERPDAQLTRFLLLLRTEMVLQSERGVQGTIDRLRSNVIAETPITLEVVLREEDRWRSVMSVPSVPLKGIHGLDELVGQLDGFLGDLERERGRGYREDVDGPEM